MLCLCGNFEVSCCCRQLFFSNFSVSFLSVWQPGCYILFPLTSRSVLESRTWKMCSEMISEKELVNGCLSIVHLTLKFKLVRHRHPLTLRKKKCRWTPPSFLYCTEQKLQIIQFSSLSVWSCDLLAQLALALSCLSWQKHYQIFTTRICH